MSMLQTKVSVRRRIAQISICAFAFCLPFPPASAGERDSVKIAVEGGFPPFNYLDAKNELQGFDIEIASALCENAHLSCEFVVQKWDSIIPDLLAKKYDVILSSMSMSEERRKLVAFSDKYYTSPSVFIARKNETKSDVGLEALKTLKIGVTFGTAQASYVENFLKPLAAATIFANSPELYKGLAEGDVDVILEDKLAVFDWLTNTKAGQCCGFVGADITDVTYFGEGAGIAFRPEDEDLRDRFNTALATIQSDGIYDMLNAKYFPFSIR